jgi:hypothetical protein
MIKYIANLDFNKLVLVANQEILFCTILILNH